MNDIIFCATTCRRYDLFVKTMDSFLKNCLDKDLISKWIIIDDGSTQNDLNKMKTKYPFLDIKRNPKPGHNDAVNYAYSILDSEYVFWCEDDWDFIKAGDYIHYAWEIMDTDKSIKEVQLRKWECIPKITNKGRKYFFHKFHAPKTPDNDSHWPGFSLNPSICHVPSMKQIFPMKSTWFELHAGVKMIQKRFNVAHSAEKYIEHIGEGVSAYKLMNRKR